MAGCKDDKPASKRTPRSNTASTRAVLSQPTSVKKNNSIIHVEIPSPNKEEKEVIRGFAKCFNYTISIGPGRKTASEFIFQVFMPIGCSYTTRGMMNNTKIVTWHSMKGTANEILAKGCQKYSMRIKLIRQMGRLAIIIEPSE